MHRITPPEGGSQAVKDYFDGALLRGDYLGQEIIGEWGGRAAPSFGLEGEVSREAFHQLCDNINPATGKRLTARTRGNRRPGYDFNFHCPKSVSTVYALTKDERILEAFRASYQETLLEEEQDAECRVSGQGPFATRKTGNLVWGEFIHTTSRPVDGVPDPHLHSHVFVFNATWDGQMWKAADFGAIKQSAPYFEAAFHARFAGRMAQMGYPIKREGKFWDIAGIPPSVREKFSRRSAEIDALAKELGIVDPKALDQLGAKSRQAKTKGMSTEQLRDAWDSWLTPEERTAIHKTNSEADGTPRVPQITTAESLSYATEHVFERKSVVSNRDLAEAALRRGFGAVGVEDVWRRMDGLIERETLITAKKDGIDKVTTRQVLGEEREMLAFARDGRGTCGTLARRDYKFGDPLFNDPTKDTAEQQAAIRRVLGSHDRVIDIRGGAGTGKTTLMREVVRGVHGEVVRAIQDGGHKVYAFAPTADASRGVLRSEGFDGADTVARLLMDKRLQQRLRGQVIWVDESGLLGSPTLNRVFKVAKAQGCRVILTGDTKQHTGVERGDAVRVLEKYGGVDPIEITKIQRQRVHKGPEPKAIKQYRRAVKALSEGDPAGAFDRLDRMGAVVEFDPDSEVRERYQRIAEDYLQALAGRNRKGKANTVLAVSPTHAEGNAVTDQIREALREAGRVGKRERETAQLVNLNWTEAERTDTAKYQPGQVVQFHQNVKGGIKRGERFTVVETDGDEVRVSGTDGGATRTLPLDAAARFSVYAERSLPLAKGDRIRITQNGYTSNGKHRLNNGALYDVAGFTRKGDIRLNNGWIVDGRYGHIAHGYVTTSHASQGKTVDVVLIAQGAQSFGASSLEQFYVSVSRGKDRVQIYTDDKDGLRGAIARSSQRMSAMELTDNDDGKAKNNAAGSQQAKGQSHQRRQFKVRLRNRQARQMKDKHRRKFRSVMDRRRNSQRGKHHEQGMDGR